jgi:hypothetical protein
MTSGARLISALEPGVMSMNWRPTDRLAAYICIGLLSNLLSLPVRRITYEHIDRHLSVYMVHVNITAASLSKGIADRLLAIAAYNSSKQRIGDPMASQSASKRQTCENDFSPPERVLAPRPSLLSLVMSGSTCEVSTC